MSKKDDGGPAFPVVPTMEGAGQWGYAYPGMSLRAYAAINLRQPDSGIDWLDEMILKANRDEFVGQAMAGIIAFYGISNVAASTAYSLADAMIAERSKP